MAAAEPMEIENLHAKQVQELSSIGMIISMSIPAAKEEQLNRAIEQGVPLELISGDYENMTADDFRANFFVMCNVLRYPPFQVRPPSQEEARIIFEAYVRKNKTKLGNSWADSTTDIHIVKLQRLWSCLRKLWAGSPHSRCPEIQTLKNMMLAKNNLKEKVQEDSSSDIAGSFWGDSDDENKATGGLEEDDTPDSATEDQESQQARGDNRDDENWLKMERAKFDRLVAEGTPDPSESGHSEPEFKAASYAGSSDSDAEPHKRTKKEVDLRDNDNSSEPPKKGAGSSDTDAAMRKVTKKEVDLRDFDSSSEPPKKDQSDSEIEATQPRKFRKEDESDNEMEETQLKEWRKEDESNTEMEETQLGEWCKEDTDEIERLCEQAMGSPAVHQDKLVAGSSLLLEERERIEEQAMDERIARGSAMRPEGRMEDLAANPPPPALVETKRGPKTPKRSTSSRKDEPSRSRSRSKSANKQHVQKEPTDEEISQSFLPEYQHLLDVLPHSLYPRSCKHGNHSYTQNLRKARVEVLLRQRAFKPKANVQGEPIACRSISFQDDVQTAWAAVKKAIGMEDD